MIFSTLNITEINFMYKHVLLSFELGGQHVNPHDEM